jgi:tRNA pseudouridine38-40 synthase
MTPASPDGYPEPRAGEAPAAEAYSGADAFSAREAVATEAEPSVRLRLDLSYDGTGFSGWARQPGQRTVQCALEEALGRLLRLPPPRLTVAGRTDAGVHARGQVAHTDVPAASWDAVMDGAVARLRRLLPGDVRLGSARRVPVAFDARFSALWRRYSYRVCDDPAGPDPLRRHEIAWHRRRLAIDRMNTAAQILTGEHDFAAFCRKRDGATTIRSLIRLDWARERADVAVATVVADAFCHNMVRALAGALLAVGDGRRPVCWPADVLKAGVRDPAVHVAPAHGLCLEEVRYPPDAELGRRAAQTRGTRQPGPRAVPAPGAAAAPA